MTLLNTYECNSVHIFFHGRLRSKSWNLCQLYSTVCEDLTNVLALDPVPAVSLVADAPERPGQVDAPRVGVAAAIVG